ncbi:hypothetical protein [Enhygromyxa salina]|uniref:Uncharacterized protein n=1 Tax=Enhygromyxa salina TaxID=215803 RepID=A0A2S9YNG7_9BACT|nr:hypothetical protein [Enhygromyxa salina]PRQ06631.1 hypothetical protein ENSA7_36900 [Enhygromyxa salina]
MTDEPIPFQLDLTTTNGRQVASAANIDDCFELREWTTWLRVRSEVSGYVPPALAPGDEDVTSYVPPVFERDGLAVLVVTRSFEDLTGSTIGLFYLRLDGGALDTIRATVEQTPWVDLPDPTGGAREAPTVRLHYAGQDFVVQRAFNAACGSFLEAIDPLWRLLLGHSNRVFKHACAALRLSSSATQSPEHPGSWELTITLRNLGRDPVVLTDPRVPSTDDAGARLSVRFGVAPDDESWPVLNTTPVLTPSLPNDAPHVVTLASRRGLVLVIPWRPPGPGRYCILVTWQDYRGPLDAAPGQIPFMPLPSSGPPYVGSGPYPIRGALSGRVVVDVPSPAK